MDDPAGHMTPCSPLSRYSIPQALPWLLCSHLAEVSLSSGFSGHPPPMTYAEMPLIFFLLLLRFLVLSACCSPVCYCRQIFHRVAYNSPSSCGCSECFVSLKIFFIAILTGVKICHCPIRFSICWADKMADFSNHKYKLSFLKNIIILIFRFQYIYGIPYLEQNARRNAPQIYCKHLLSRFRRSCLYYRRFFQMHLLMQTHLEKPAII